MSDFVELIEEVRKIFSVCNEHISRKMSLFPNLHEPYLDQELVTAASLVPLSPIEIVLKSGWKCHIDLRFTGGVYFGEDREVADLAILVHCRKDKIPVRTKIALCQSKRLYPNKLKTLKNADREKFEFRTTSRYKALKVRDEQWKVVEHWDTVKSIKVHYLLYHPCEISSIVHVPLDPTQLPSLDCNVGLRVLPASSVRQALTGKPDDYSPTYSELYDKAPRLLPYSGNWRFEDFVAALLIGCKVGTLAKDLAESEEFDLRYRRSWPISSSIVVTIDLPDGAELPSENR